MALSKDQLRNMLIQPEISEKATLVKKLTAVTPTETRLFPKPTPEIAPMWTPPERAVGPKKILKEYQEWEIPSPDVMRGLKESFSNTTDLFKWIQDYRRYEADYTDPLTGKPLKRPPDYILKKEAYKRQVHSAWSKAKPELEEAIGLTSEAALGAGIAIIGLGAVSMVPDMWRYYTAKKVVEEIPKTELRRALIVTHPDKWYMSKTPKDIAISNWYYSLDRSDQLDIMKTGKNIYYVPRAKGFIVTSKTYPGQFLGPETERLYLPGPGVSGRTAPTTYEMVKGHPLGKPGFSRGEILEKQQYQQWLKDRKVFIAPTEEVEVTGIAPPVPLPAADEVDVTELSVDQFLALKPVDMEDFYATYHEGYDKELVPLKERKEALQKDFDKSEKRSEKRKKIKEELDTVAEEIKALEGESTERFMDAQLKIREELEKRITDRYEVSEDTELWEILDEFFIRTSERGYLERYWETPHSEVLEEVIGEYIEDGTLVPRAGVRPTEVAAPPTKAPAEAPREVAAEPSTVEERVSALSEYWNLSRSEAIRLNAAYNAGKLCEIGERLGAKSAEEQDALVEEALEEGGEEITEAGIAEEREPKITKREAFESLKESIMIGTDYVRKHLVETPTGFGGVSGELEIVPADVVDNIIKFRKAKALPENRRKRDETILKSVGLTEKDITHPTIEHDIHFSPEFFATGELPGGISVGPLGETGYWTEYGGGGRHNYYHVYEKQPNGDILCQEVCLIQNDFYVDDANVAIPIVLGKTPPSIPPKATREVAPPTEEYIPPTAKEKGDYVFYGARLMIFDRWEGNKAILEDPFYEKGQYPVEVSKDELLKLELASANEIRSEYKRVMGKVPKEAEKKIATIPGAPGPEVPPALKKVTYQGEEWNIVDRRERPGKEPLLYLSKGDKWREGEPLITPSELGAAPSVARPEIAKVKLKDLLQRDKKFADWWSRAARAMYIGWKPQEIYNEFLKYHPEGPAVATPEEVPPTKAPVSRKAKPLKLQDAMKTAQRIINKKSYVPVLTNVLVQDGNLIATDLETVYVVKTDKPDGLYKFIGNNLEPSDLDAKEFPEIPYPRINVGTVSSREELITNLERAMLSVSTDETRYVITGVLLDVKGGKGSIVSTDGRRASVSDIAVENFKDGQYIISSPKKVLAALNGISGESLIVKTDAGKEISPGEKEAHTISFQGDNGLVINRLIEGKFPDYAAPYKMYKYEQQYIVNKDMLKGALLTLRPYAVEETKGRGSPWVDIRQEGLAGPSRDITLTAGPEKNLKSTKLTIEVKSVSYTPMKGTMIMPMRDGDQPRKIRLQINYLLDAVKSVKTDYVFMGLTDRESMWKNPVHIYGEDLSGVTTRAKPKLPLWVRKQASYSSFFVSPTAVKNAQKGDFALLQKEVEGQEPKLFGEIRGPATPKGKIRISKEEIEALINAKTTKVAKAAKEYIGEQTFYRAFKPKGTGGLKILGEGLYVSPTKEGAKFWGEDVRPVKAKIENPLILQPNETLKSKGWDGKTPAKEWAISQGYDAIVKKSVKLGHDHINLLTKKFAEEVGPVGPETDIALNGGGRITEAEKIQLKLPDIPVEKALKIVPKFLQLVLAKPVDVLNKVVAQTITIPASRLTIRILNKITPTFIKKWVIPQYGLPMEYISKVKTAGAEKALARMKAKEITNQLCPPEKFQRLRIRQLLRAGVIPKPPFESLVVGKWQPPKISEEDIIKSNLTFQPELAKRVAGAIQLSIEAGWKLVEAGLLGKQTFWKHYGQYLGTLYTSKELAFMEAKKPLFPIRKRLRLKLQELKRKGKKMIQWEEQKWDRQIKRTKKLLRKINIEQIKGIKGITSLRLKRAGYTLDRLVDASVEDLKKIRGISDEKAEYIIEAANDLANQNKKFKNQLAHYKRMKEFAGERIAREGMPYEIRKRLGEILEPAYPWSKRYLQSIHDAVTAELFNDVANIPEWCVDTEEAIPPDASFVQMPESKKLGPLSGKWVLESIADDINATIRIPSLIESYYNNFLGLWKWGKVVPRLGTHARNIQMDFVFAYMAGLDPYRVDIFESALKDYIQKGPVRMRGVEQGWLETEYYQAEIRFSLEQWGVTPGNIIDKMGAILRKGAEKMGTLYAAEDQIFKMAIWKLYQEKGFKPQECDRMVDLFMPNYKNVPKITRVLRKIPIGAPFFSFTSEMARIFKNACIYSPVRLAIVLAIPTMLGVYSWKRLQKKGYRLGWKEYKQLKKELPDYMRKGMHVILPIQDKYGRFAVVDLTYTLGWGDWVELGFAPLRLFSNPFSTFFVKLKTGTDPFSKRKIIQPEYNIFDKCKAWVNEIYRDIMPSIAPPIPFLTEGGYDWKRLSDSLRGKPDYNGRLTPPSTIALSAFAGIKINWVDLAFYPARDLVFEISNLDKRMRVIMRDARYTDPKTGYLNEEGERYIRQLMEKREKLLRESGLTEEQMAVILGKPERAGIPRPSKTEEMWLRERLKTLE